MMLGFEYITGKAADYILNSKSSQLAQLIFGLKLARFKTF